MLKALLRLVLVGGLLAGWSFSGQALQGAEQIPNGLHVHLVGSDGVILTAGSGAFKLENGALQVDGTQVNAQPGQPRLPVYSALLGVPPGAQVEVEVLSDDALILSAAYKVEVQPFTLPGAGDSPQPQAVQTPAALSVPALAWYPSQPARVAQEAWLRDMRLVRIEISPFQLLPATGQLLWHRSLRVAVRFVHPQRVEPPVGDPQGVEPPLLASLILNYDQARSWRAAPADLPMAPAVVTTPSGARTRIVVEQDGLYQLSAADLQSAGYDLAALDPHKLRLYNQGQEVAIHILGEADGVFDSGDKLLFYGEKLRGDRLAARYAAQDDNWLLLGSSNWQAHFTPQMIEKYTTQNIYWLVLDTDPGLRMDSLAQNADGVMVQTNPHTVRVEKSNSWWASNFTGEDTWFWQRINNYTPYIYAISLPDPLESSVYSATVRGELVSYVGWPDYTPDHHTLFQLNGATVQNAYWDGVSRYAFSGQVTQNNLLNGTNNLTVTNIKDAFVGESYQTMYFDWYEVTYERLLVAQADELTFSEDQAGDWYYQTFGFTSTVTYAVDVTQPQAPALGIVDSSSGLAELKLSAAAGQHFFLSGSLALRAPVSISAYSPPDLLSAVNGADYVIVTVPEFAAAAQRLADQRAAQGLQVRILLFQDLINQFNEGIYHPLAIKSFLSYAYTHWSPAPSFIVLIGDGHFNLLGNNPGAFGTSPVYLPPNLEFVDYTNGEIDATNNLANIVGTDALADVSIGRIPVNSVAELDVVIDKILAYENGGLNQPWHRRVTFVADNTPDEAGDFPAFSDDLDLNYLPDPFIADKIYLDDLACLPGNAGACPNVTTAIRNGLSDPGALFLSYIGHGHIARWTSEQVVNNTIAATLTNSTRLPVALAMTCYEGYWSLPNPLYTPALAEVLLRNPAGGTVASFSATGWGTTYDHHIMERGIFDAVFTNHVDRLGLATDYGKLALFSVGSGADVLQTFLIIGDPALKLHLPPYAAFTATPLSGYGATTVNFTNQSTGDYTTLTWDFGDGSPASSLPDPSHSYAAEGVYTVTLTVEDGAGNSDIEVKVDYIVVTTFKVMLPLVLR